MASRISRFRLKTLLYLKCALVDARGANRHLQLKDIMRLGLSLSLTGLVVLCSSAQAQPGIGTGSPNAIIQAAFANAWLRNGFSRLVGAPLGNVTNFGSTGLIQQFPSVTNSNVTLALIKPDMSSTANVFQVLAPMYAYYGTVSVGTAGYPVGDTVNCPAPLRSTSADNSCQWQLFTNNYALFAYTFSLQSGSQNFATRDPFYTKWTTLGGMQGLGPATSAETQITSQYNSGATGQTFDQGAIYNITSGVLSGRLLAVAGPVYTLYASYGAAAGSLGLPVTEELLLPNGMLQQTFEGGAIEHDPKTGIVVLRPPINSLALSPNGSIHMNVGDTRMAQVILYAADGTVLTDRTVAWNTSNGSVVQIQASGLSATLRAVGAGTAVITVSGEGKTSATLNISVTALCCQIGEGAPTAAIQQAFQNAVSRNNLSVQLPAASTATRVGNGYVQQLQSTGTTPIPYLVAVADGSITGYVISGTILSQYLNLGGAAGALGYPVSDATSGGRQSFQGGTLAGNPVQAVTGAILAKWGTLGYETGAAGSPTGGASTFQTFRGTAGTMQPFQNALIVAATTGPLAGQTFWAMGLILAKYSAHGGPAGDLGAPLNDEHAINGLRQQDFEGGYINYAPGDSTANLVTTPRQPLVTATPSTVISGTPVHLVAGGFNNGATVRVSQTGQPDFMVTVSNGAYAWDVQIAATAASGVVTIKAADVNGTAAAQGSYTVRNASSSPLVLSAESGDSQIGAPGAQLAQPLVVVVQDQNGNPLAGQTVNFAASPGAQVGPASAVTGANGQASTTLRMPISAGVALATAQAGNKVVTFSARTAPFSLTNFPQLTQAVAGTLGNGSATIQQQGALLTAVASILRYYQLLNQLPQPNGLADAVTLNQFLKSLCTVDAQGNQICDGFVSLGQSSEQTVNLWRLGAFIANNIDVRIMQTDLSVVRDRVASGSPIVLALSLGSLGSHFVVATGIASDGSLLIADPNPAFAQTSLSGYLNGFNAAGVTIQGTLSGAVNLVPQAPSSAFFVVASAPIGISSVVGPCGQTLQFPDTAAVVGAMPANRSGTLYFRSCDGATGPYQLDIGAQGAYNAALTDLSAKGGRTVLSGSAATSSEIVQTAGQWTLAPLSVSIAATGVVNAASFTNGVAPGGLISIYGVGFSHAGAATSVQINGEAAPVLSAYPFQVNAQIPLDIPPGSATLNLNSGNGTAQQTIAITDAAPAIFSIAASQAAITNQDNSLNTPASQALRGKAIVIYGTGLGAVSPSGGLSVVNTAVSVVIGGVEIPAFFAGLTPGTTGLYQVNVLLPPTLPPGLFLPLYLREGAATSNVVSVAVQ